MHLACCPVCYLDTLIRVKYQVLSDLSNKYEFIDQQVLMKLHAWPKQSHKTWKKRSQCRHK